MKKIKLNLTRKNTSLFVTGFLIMGFALLGVNQTYKYLDIRFVWTEGQQLAELPPVEYKNEGEYINARPEYPGLILAKNNKAKTSILGNH